MKTLNIKMIGLDLDGTLLNSNKEISDRTRSTLMKAMEQGVIVLPATGRPSAGIPKSVMTFPGIRYALTSNGARVLDLEKSEVVYENLLPYEDGLKVLEILSKYDASLELYFSGDGYTEKAKLENLEKYMKNPHMREYMLTTRIRVDNILEYYKERGEGADKINILFADASVREEAWAAVLEQVPTAVITTALDNNMEINGAGAKKGLGLVALGKILGIEKDEIMACGDGLNDAEMLKEVGFGVAMENASELVKESADYITLTNDEDGVADAIEKFVLK